MANPQSIDQEFSDSYNQQGIQPSTGNVSSIRKVKAEYNDPTARRKERPGANVIAGTGEITGVGMQAAGKTAKVAGNAIMTAGRALSATGVGAIVGVPLMVAGGAVRGSGSAVNNSGKVVKRGSRTMRKSARKKKMLLLGSKISSRARVTSVNGMIWSWVPITWLVFQLPFAVVSIAFFGMAVAIDSLAAYVTESNGVFKVLGDVVASVASSLAAAAKYLFDFDITVLNPTNFFMITYMVVFAYGLFVLLAIYLIYKVAGLNPLSGKGAGMKQGCLLLAFIGYSIPGANLFPWFIPWVLAVWVYPK
ncbi:MAG: hypothetical protein ACI9BF_000195 [Candidatus Paceibacteria bacterium]|jgi:hypothetical protein